MTMENVMMIGLAVLELMPSQNNDQKEIIIIIN